MATHVEDQQYSAPHLRRGDTNMRHGLCIEWALRLHLCYCIGVDPLTLYSCPAQVSSMACTHHHHCIIIIYVIHSSSSLYHHQWHALIITVSSSFIITVSSYLVYRQLQSPHEDGVEAPTVPCQLATDLSGAV
jgi:hypothetical protein